MLCLISRRKGEKAPNSMCERQQQLSLALRVLLETSDGDAAEAFLSLESAFAGACDKLRMYALGEDISEFNFDSALLKLDVIAERIMV